MTDRMVERVAKAIHLAREGVRVRRMIKDGRSVQSAPPAAWDPSLVSAINMNSDGRRNILSHQARTTYREAARAAILAMREPTETMLSAGWRGMHGEEGVPPEHSWPMMIDDALK